MNFRIDLPESCAEGAPERPHPAPLDEPVEACPAEPAQLSHQQSWVGCPADDLTVRHELR